MAIAERPIHQMWPRLDLRVPFVGLADLPTPVSRLEIEPGAPPLWVKRDDLTSPVYGGNKVRTLEVLFADALRAGAKRVVSTGAFGSNHAVATVLHAPRAGLEGGALLFPQPWSRTAGENLRVLGAFATDFSSMPHWSALPLALWRFRRAERQHGRSTLVMVPGGATPAGALGYVSAALELADQVARGEMPRPEAIVVGVGSTCTSAGLLLGLSIAAARDVGFARPGAAPAPPRLVSVRVTPWPVTSAWRIVGLAVRASHLLADLTGDRTVRRTHRELAGGLAVDGRYLGSGYGHATDAGRRAMDLFAGCGGPPLDTTYSAKSAACALDRLRQGSKSLLYWATKSSSPLPEVAALGSLSTRALGWLERGAAIA